MVMNLNETKPNKNAGRFPSGKKLVEHNKRVRKRKKKKEGLKQSEGLQLKPESEPEPAACGQAAGQQAPEGSSMIIILTHSNSFSNKCRSLTGWTIL